MSRPFSLNKVQAIVKEDIIFTPLSMHKCKNNRNNISISYEYQHMWPSFKAI